MTWHLTVPGRPVPAVRMTTRSKWSQRARQSLSYQQQVAYYAVAAKLPRPVPGEYVALTITIYLQAVKGRLPGRRGDIDNLHKAVQDGLQYAGVLANDRCVVESHVRLVPTPGDDRVEIELTALEEGLLWKS